MATTVLAAVATTRPVPLLEQRLALLTDAIAAHPASGGAYVITRAGVGMAIHWLAEPPLEI